jgi:hypothetical protein
MSVTPRKGTRRACDPCSVRKVRCEGNQPCSRCEAANWDCTYLKKHGKSGPRGPRRTTEAAIRKLQERSQTSHDGSRSNSEASLDAISPSATELPDIDLFSGAGGVRVDRFGGSDVTNQACPDAPQEPQKITTSCLSHYLEIYQTRGYGIWPVVNAEFLTARLITDPHDREAYALATAISAAVISQFSIDDECWSPVEGFDPVSSSTFERASRKAREQADHLESLSLYSILSSFFLHVYSANVGRMKASTILLGEAVAKAHIIGLHKPGFYSGLVPEQLQHSLRVWWLLFITERAHSIQHDVPMTLHRTSDLPRLENLNDGSVNLAFLQLCKLFRILDITITANATTARAALAVAQQELNSDEASLSLENELQRADITMTQQWMRIFLWQHALNVTKLSSTNTEGEFSFYFPAKVAHNVLRSMNSLSQQSIEAHGPGMVCLNFVPTRSLLTECSGVKAI